MHFRPLDKLDSMLLKGIAILLIAAHNFLHLVKPAPNENEFNFDAERFQRYLHNIDDNPAAVVQQSLAYFGHYGVQIFIFLSAYGLTRKYASAQLNYGHFLWQRALKIYPAFLLAFALWLALATIGGGVAGPWHRLQAFGGDILLKLFPFSNTSDVRALRPIGPWWFLPFIIQFYIVYPVILAAARRFGVAVLPGFALLSYVLLASLHGHGLILYYKVIGHMPEFCLGMYLTIRPDTRLPSWLLAVSAVTFVLGNFYSAAWRFSPLSALLLLLALWQWAGVWVRNQPILRVVLVFTGTISMQIFFVNGYLRDYFLPLANGPAGTLAVFGVCLLFLLVTLLVSWLLTRIDHAMSLRKT